MVESRQGEALSIVGVFAVVAFVFLATRLYSRYLGRNFGWDDYLILFASVLLLGEVIATWEYILISGTGYHIWDLPKKSTRQQETALRWSFAIQLLYHPMMGAIRASIIVFLFRMKDYRRRIRYSLHFVFWLNILYAVGACLAALCQCSPVRYAWAKPAMDHEDASGHLIDGGTCINSRTFILTSNALSIFMDLIIIPIPSVMVWHLQMCRRDKILVIIVMSLGWIATGVSAGRFVVYYYRIASTDIDRTWNIGIVISIVEPSVHIMTACAPATRRLFRHLFPSFAVEQTRAPNEDGNTVIPAPRMSGFGSRASRNFNLDVSNSQSEDSVFESRSGPESSIGSTKDGNSVYDSKALGRMDSRNKNEARVRIAAESRKSREPRISCSKTACTEKSEPVEAEPQHCLDEEK